MVLPPTQKLWVVQPHSTAALSAPRSAAPFFLKVFSQKKSSGSMYGDILFRIFTDLDPFELFACMLVNTEWCSLARDAYAASSTKVACETGALERAIRVAKRGATLLLHPGRYRVLAECRITIPLKICAISSGSQVPAPCISCASLVVFRVHTSFVLQGVTVEGGTVGWQSGAIVSVRCGAVFISDCTILSTGQNPIDTCTGIWVGARSHVQITRCNISCGIRIGIIVFHGTLYATYCNIRTVDGVVALGGHVLVSHNTIEADQYGVVSCSNTTLQVNNNKIHAKRCVAVKTGGEFYVTDNHLYSSIDGPPIQVPLRIEDASAVRRNYWYRCDV